MYSGPHVAMDKYYAVLGRETLKKLESHTKCPFAFTTNDLYAEIPAASSSQFSEEFLCQDLSSKHSFFDLPVDKFEVCILYYRRTTQAHPNTSACLMVPRKKGPWSSYISRMKLIHTIHKGTPFYSNAITHELVGPAITTMDIYFNPPAPVFSIAKSLLEWSTQS